MSVACVSSTLGSTPSIVKMRVKKRFCSAKIDFIGSYFFSASVASRSSPGMRRKVSLNTYTPTKILPTPPATLKSTKASNKAVTSLSPAVASHASTRKKSLPGKTEGHEHKKSTGKKRWIHARTRSSNS